MSKLLKKVVSVASATAITLSIVTPATSVSAYSDMSVESANKLAAQGVIVDNSSNPAAYNLDSEITRREMAKVMMNLSGMEVSETCEGKFSDLTSSDWGCKYAEAALANNFVAANASFNADSNISKWESLKFILSAKGFEKAEGVEPFQAAYVQAALDNGFISASFSDYDAPAKRDFIFDTAANTLEASDVVVEDEDDIFDDIFGEDTATVDEDNTDTDTDDTTTPNSSITDDVLQVELSPMSPVKGTKIPTNTPRVTMLAFDVTAGTDDVELKNVMLEAAGFGATANIDDVVLYNKTGEKITRQRSINSDDEVQLDFLNDFTVKAGQTVSLIVTAKINASAVNGDVYALNLVELNASSDVDGAPINGANLESVTISNQGELKVKSDTATVDIEVGKNAKLAGLKFKNDNDKEDISLKTIRIQQTGGVDEDYIQDMYVEIDGKEVVSDLEFSKEYVTINFGEEGFVLPKSKSSYYTMAVYGTVTGDPTKTVEFDIEDTDDIYAVGVKSGYNTPIIDLTSGFALSTALTVDGAAVNVSFDKSANDASNVDVDDFNFGTLNLSSASGDYNLEDYTIELTITPVTGYTLTANDLLENIKLGSYSAKDELVLGTVSSGTAKTYEVNFEDITLSKGSSKELELTADINKDAAKDKISYKFDLSFKDDSFKLKDEDNNETYDKTADIKDIFSTYSGLDTRTVDVEGASLAFTTNTIDSQDIVLGNYTTTTYKGYVEAGSAADVKITNLTFSNASTTNGADLEEVLAKATITIGTDTYTTTDFTTDEIRFDSISKVVKAGSANRTLVKLDVQFKDADDTIINTDNKITLAISGLEAEDNQAGTDLTFGTDATFDGGNSMTATLTTVGTFDIEIYDTKNDSNVELFDRNRFALAGTEGYKLFRLDMEADKEKAQVKKLVFTSDMTSPTLASTGKDSIQNVKLVNKSGTLIANATLTTDGNNLVATFDDINSFYVDTEKETFYVVADIRSIDEDANAAGATSGTAYNFVLSTDSEVEGEQSAELINADEVDADASTVTIVGSSVSTIEVAKATAKPAADQFFETAYITINSANNAENIDASNEELKPSISEITLNKGDFVFTGIGAGATYNVRVRNVDTDVIVSAATTAFTGSVDLTIDQGAATDREIDGQTRFVVEVEIAGATVDVDSSYSVKVDREKIT